MAAHKKTRMINEKVGIIILNYLNYKDTIECIDSALKIRFPSFEIVVVDNGSQNQSIAKLKKRYSNSSIIHMLANEKNLGFAKGNNTGITYAREVLGCSYILCVNNDIIFNDRDIIRTLITFDDGETAVIGPRITGRDGLDQSPVNTGITYNKILRDLFFSSLFSLVDIDLLRRLPGIKSYLKRKKQKGIKNPANGHQEIILHGSALLFTPFFFRHFKGFYPGTFLYYEENILAVLLQNNKLKIKYVPTTTVYHKEDMSSTLSFGNKNRTKSRFQRSSVMKCFLMRLFRTRRF